VSAPTKGPYVVDGLYVYGPKDPRSRYKNGRVLIGGVATERQDWHGYFVEIELPQHTKESLANAHLLAASWEMREALQAVHDWRGLCDANDLETFERIGEMFRKDTGYLRPGKDDARGYDREKVSAAWDAGGRKKNDEMNARIRAALAKAQGERHEG